MKQCFSPYAIIALAALVLGCGGKGAEGDVDCGALEPGPFAATLVEGSIAGEDFAFDPEGNLVGIGDYAIFKTPYRGEPELFVSGIYYDSGMAWSPDGRLLVADNSLNALVAIDSEGASHVIASNLSWPNGIAPHPSGWALVTEFAADRISRVDLATGETTVAAMGIPGANGIAFGPDRERLYVGSFWDGEIRSFSVGADGSLGDEAVLVEDVGAQLDGIGVDECGNVYACGHDNGAVYRFSPEGAAEIIVEAGTFDHAGSIRWGRGIGGWRDDAAYVSDYSSVWEIDLGVGPAVP